MPSLATRILLGLAVAASPVLFVMLPAQSQDLPAAGNNAVWHNVTQDRALNATYRNLVQYPIQVSVATRSGKDGTCAAKLSVNGVEVAYQIIAQPNGIQLCSISATIPKAASYVVDTASFAGSRLELWSELY